MNNILLNVWSWNLTKMKATAILLSRTTDPETKKEAESDYKRYKANVSNIEDSLIFKN